jgi:hypothetical protein
MKISELPECPAWLKNATTTDADVEWSHGPGSLIIWRGGTFAGGTFAGGLFAGGTFAGGRFASGTFDGGLFEDGTFAGGTFASGTFAGGTFAFGWFAGGRFAGGKFKGGTFDGGRFEGGTFAGGRTSIRGPYRTIINENGTLSIGCETMTFEKWREWFDGTEEFQTERGTEKFRMIEAQFRAIDAWNECMKKGIK